MTWQQLVGICVGTAAILACLYGLAKLTRDLMSGMRRLSRMLDDWLGEPEHPGYPGTGRPGVIARLASVEENVASMKLQLSVVSRLEREVAQLKAMAEQAQPTDSAFLNSHVERSVESGQVESGPVVRYGLGR